MQSSRWDAKQTGAWNRAMSYILTAETSPRALQGAPAKQHSMFHFQSPILLAG
jgi:hypothetical protein